MKTPKEALRECIQSVTTHVIPEEEYLKGEASIECQALLKCIEDYAKEYHNHMLTKFIDV